MDGDCTAQEAGCLEKSRGESNLMSKRRRAAIQPDNGGFKMLLTRYEPWSAMRQLQNEMSRVFDNAVAGAEDGSNVVTSRWTPRWTSGKTPNVS